MSFLIRLVSHTADEREIVRASRIEKPQISVGRAGGSDVHLTDLAVLPYHVCIERLSGRTLSVRAVGTLGFRVDGKPVMRAEIDADTGAELRLGAHRITITAGDGDEIVLSVQRVEALSEATIERDEQRAFSLAGKLPGRRLTAWGLLLAILVGFLAVPIISYASRPAIDTRNIHTVKGDAPWSSGPLSRAHHALEGKCESCHEKAFVSVRDSACQTCHTRIHDHASAPRIAMARAEPGLGGKLLDRVAAAFGKPPAGACVDCHSEHEGAGPMQPTAQAFCTDCHGSLRERLADTALGDAADFGTAHPQFRPAVMKGGADFAYPLPRFERVSLDARPNEEGALKFPHDVHLAKAGGVARMARRSGQGDALVCADCHRTSADGVRFEPVEMERDCQSCHSLALETIGGTVRTLRHGDPAQVTADLTAYYRSTPPARPAQLEGAVRRRPGLYAQGQVYAAYFGEVSRRPARADDAVRAVFSPGGACYDCHIVAPPGANGKTGWQIAPVHQPMRYMMKGWFDHRAHSTQTCESCHAAPASKRSGDLLLPGIATCRTCHGGEKARAPVPSSCALCHSYHAAQGAPWSPSGRVAGRTDEGG
ncbi:cytochrome c3 family protein [Sphingobium sp. AN641]|uniref:cytochrome c3 family protein n=1 Tax=Sphingobium sp. AN641 TaxID=3133443 RepID=UPI0030BEC8CA